VRQGCTGVRAWGNADKVEPIAKVLKREELVIPTKVVIQSFQYFAKIFGFPFARE
jgi:hypothetical protein